MSSWVKRAGPGGPPPKEQIASGYPGMMCSPSSHHGSSVSESHYTTDDVIAELKLLAQSMLEASKEARMRVKLDDGNEDFDVDTSHNGTSGMAGMRHTAPQRGAVSTDGGAHQHHSNTIHHGSANATQYPSLTTPGAKSSVLLAKNRPSENEIGTTGKPAPPSVSLDRAQTAAPASTGVTGKPKVDTRAVPPVSVAVKSLSNGAVVVGGVSASSSAAPQQKETVVGREESPPPPNSPIDSFEIFDDEDDELDLTLTCFKPSDKDMFQRMTASLWLPEPVRRHQDGTFAGRWDPRHEEEVTQEGASSGKDKEPSSSSIGSRGYKPRSTEPQSSGTLSSPDALLKLFRVPCFPFGGGITGPQLRELTKLYERCGQRNTARQGTPSLVKEAAFRSGEFTEVSARHHRYVPATSRLHAHRDPNHSPPRAGPGLSTPGAGPSSSSSSSVPPVVFRPDTLYDFVVEIERGVQFDPLKARRERQKAFKQLAKEKKAPVTMGTFHLKVIMDATKTGFEDERTFPITRGSIIADRYQIAQLIAKSTFSRTVRCYDLEKPIYEEVTDGEGEEDLLIDTDHLEEEISKKKMKERRPVGYHEVCIKIIHNSKDFFDQSLDEIRLLRLLNEQKDPDEAHVIRLIDAFYYKEHCMLVTELLSDSLYEYSKYDREEGDGSYFSVPRLQRIARQVVEALSYVHSLNLIHSDLKPENILFVSHRRCTVKVIDFGSSCFLSDHLSSYIQSRNYRAPEVILGCDYDGRIDVWSLGAILVELVLGEVLFSSSTVPEMLARIVVECGRPLPRRMLWEGRYTQNFVTKFGAIYEVVNPKLARRDDLPTSADGTTPGETSGRGDEEDREESYYVYTPHPQPPPSPPPPPTSEDDAEGIEAEREYRFVYHHPDGSFVQLRKKLAGAGVLDELFTDFVEKCLTLDHKKRPTSKELLQHPFIRV